MNAPRNAIEVSKLNTFYGKSHILHDVSLVAEEGSVTTLLGRNGAGKTTTMRSIMGLTPARSRVQRYRHLVGKGLHRDPGK